MINKKELHLLYYIQGKTLQEIGNIYNLSRERIRQIMVSFNLKCRKSGTPFGVSKPRKSSFTSLEDYFDYVKLTGQESRPILIKFLSPFMKRCADCHSTENLHLHHLKYPALSLLDLQVLCASCHLAKHRKGLIYKTQIEICDKYSKGETGTSLAFYYTVTPQTIYNILNKWNIKTRARFTGK